MKYPISRHVRKKRKHARYRPDLSWKLGSLSNLSVSQLVTWLCLSRTWAFGETRRSNIDKAIAPIHLELAMHFFWPLLLHMLPIKQQQIIISITAAETLLSSLVCRMARALSFTCGEVHVAASHMRLSPPTARPCNIFMLIGHVPPTYTLRSEGPAGDAHGIKVAINTAAGATVTYTFRNDVILTSSRLYFPVDGCIGVGQLAGKSSKDICPCLSKLWAYTRIMHVPA